MRTLFVIGLLASIPIAHASPVDVQLSGMSTQGGVSVFNQATTSAAYAQVLRELGSFIGTPSLAPPTTTGATGIEVVLETSAMVADLYGRTKRYTTDPSPWDRVVANENAPALQWAPGLAVRKGLPFSIELALRGRWLASSGQGTLGGEIRGAIIEGRKGWPDLGLHLGYDGYIGNPELQLGTMSLGMGFGGTFKPGAEGHAHNTIIRPYLDISLLMVHATPLVDDATANQLGLSAYGAKSPSPTVIPQQKALLMPRFAAGLQFDFPHFLIRMSGAYTIHASPMFALAVGFRG